MHRQSGNVLFLILIAAALFAALSYAVTSSTRSGGGSASKEQARTNASAILSHISSLRTAVTRLKITNGCMDEQFNFVNYIYKTGHGAYTMAANTNAPSSGICDIYSPSGGNVVPITPPITARGPAYGNPASPLPGHADVVVAQMINIGTDGTAGTVSANDLIIKFFSVNKDTCLALNDLLGVSNTSGNPPSVQFRSDDYSNGTFAGNRIINSAPVNGLPSYCYDEEGTGYYSFVTALIER